MISEGKYPMYAPRTIYRWSMPKEERICPTCGKAYQPRSRTQQYCCRECRPSERKERE